jgi:predicted nucleic acid-binding protein
VGLGEGDSAVTDAGPLIHLTEIGCLPLMSIFRSLHITDSVWAETIGMGRVEETDFLALGSVQRHALPRSDVDRFVQGMGLSDLQEGERECLYLCHQMGPPILLTDDLAVREAATRLNVKPVGSLGVVAKAYRLGRISLVDAERHMTNLYDVSSLFVTRAIVDLAVERLRQSPTST